MRSPTLCLLLLTLASACFASVVISTASLPNGTLNKSYSATVYATGGCTPYKWSLVSGTLPAGITSKPSSTTTSLLLTGIPTSATTYTPTLQVTGCGGVKYKASYKIVIQAASSITITTASLPNGIVGNAYSASVTASGGCTPYKWSIAAGALPAGVTSKVSSTTTSLLLSGTPTTANTYSPTVQVTACGGGTYKDSYKIAIQGTTNHVVDLSWKASTSTDVTGYNLYRSADGMTWKKTNVSLIASTMYSDASVANGSTYYYAATSVDIYGKESSKSASIKVSVP
jgi:large repetitive protein